MIIENKMSVLTRGQTENCRYEITRVVKNGTRLFDHTFPCTLFS